jgi:DNA-binding NtrC family response regulator
VKKAPGKVVSMEEREQELEMSRAERDELRPTIYELVERSVPLNRFLAEAKRLYIDTAIEVAGGKTKAADRIGVHRNTIGRETRQA